MREKVYIRYAATVHAAEEIQLEELEPREEASKGSRHGDAEAY